MRYWQTPYLGRRSLPKELNSFELNTFFTYSPHERRAILARRQPLHQLGLALQVGFIRMTGSLLTAVKIVPASLWQHLGEVLGISSPDIASLRSLYRRKQTFFSHQNTALETLGFVRMSEHQRRALIRYLRVEVLSEFDRHRLLVQIKTWLYEHRILNENERTLRSAIDVALKLAEDGLGKAIQGEVPEPVLQSWMDAFEAPHRSGASYQEWLRQAPRKQSFPQLRGQFERIEQLTQIGVARYAIPSISDHIKRHYANAMAERASSISKRLAEPRRTVEVACFLQTALCTATDTLLTMTRQHIADLWRKGMRAVVASSEARARTLARFAKDMRGLALDRSLGEEDLRSAILSAVEQVVETPRSPVRNSRASKCSCKMPASRDRCSRCCVSCPSKARARTR